ncbi:hypothetical protein D9M68_996340 [compost metagenome]
MHRVGVIHGRVEHRRRDAQHPRQRDGRDELGGNVLAEIAIAQVRGTLDLLVARHGVDDLIEAVAGNAVGLLQDI